MSKVEHWYRFEDRPGDPPYIYLSKFKVVKHTPKGVWVEFGFYKDKFIRKDAHKHFACATIEEAKKSFIARKSRQLCILEHQIDDVRWVLAKVAELGEGSYGTYCPAEVMEAVDSVSQERSHD